MTKRILIVDDEPNIRAVITKSLYKGCGFQGEVKTVANGKDAIHEISSSFYNICFLDINLPDINGLDVMEKIKDISPDTKIAVMSGSYITDEMQGKINECALVLLEKPFNISEIKIFLKQALEC